MPYLAGSTFRRGVNETGVDTESGNAKPFGDDAGQGVVMALANMWILQHKQSAYVI